jgi:hypothetical protein
MALGRIFQDIHHVSGRITTTVHRGTSNPRYGEVARAVGDCFFRQRAIKGGKGERSKPAVFRSPQDQAERLAELISGERFIHGIWTEASVKVIQNEIEHALKGCCSHSLDLPSDTSRVESTHKEWRQIQHGVTGSWRLLVLNGHHLVLRRNIRTALNNGSASAFLTSTQGSSHLSLIHHINSLHNKIFPHLPPLPLFKDVKSGERFGVVRSVLLLKGLASQLILQRTLDMTLKVSRS